MSPLAIVKAIETLIDEYRHEGNVTAQRNIGKLLKLLRGLTNYTDELIGGMQRASDNFYGWTDRDVLASEEQYRLELLAAIHRLKNGFDMMEAQLPKDIQVDME